MSKLELLHEIIKDGFVEQTVRIQIYPMHSYSPKDIGKIREKYNISEEEFEDLLEVKDHHVTEGITTYKQTFGFYNFKEPFDKLEFIFSKGKIYDLGNPEIVNSFKEQILGKSI